MNRLLFACALALLGGPILAAPEDEMHLRVKVGDPAPAFTVTTTERAELSLAKLKRKVIVLSFFGESDPPTLELLRYFEDEVQAKFKDRALAVVALGRERTVEDLAKFKADQKFTFTIASDPKRAAYDQYARKFLPRVFVIGADGRLVFTSAEGGKAEREQMLQTIKTALLKAR